MMLSSVLIGSDLSRCRQIRATGYVLKPVDADELLTSILQVLEPASRATIRPLAANAQEEANPVLTILLAEDNAINRKLASTLLRKAGHEVVTVENGRDAVAELEKRDFDVVLMDVQMPIMDGFEAASCIRNLKDKQRASVPIIALTAHALQGYRERCLQAGMNDYLTKPIDTVALMKLLNDIAARPVTY
jgi:CheY-like chemotaxis protein